MCLLSCVCQHLPPKHRILDHLLDSSSTIRIILLDRKKRSWCHFFLNTSEYNHHIISRFQSEMTSWAPILAKMACLSSIREAEQSSTRMDFSWSVFLALLLGGGRAHFFQNKPWTGSLKSTSENLGYNNWFQVFCWHNIAPFPLLLCQESFPMPKANGSSYVVPNHWHPLAPIRPHTRHVKKSWSFDQWPRLAEIRHIFVPGRPSCRRICSSPWMRQIEVEGTKKLSHRNSQHDQHT